MRLFSIKNGTAKRIPSTKIGLEKDIQKIFEENLNEILDVNFLATEYSTGSGERIDTLGIDNHGSPVIIEYKRSQNANVINQGLSYLYWLLDHKANFEALVRRVGIDIAVDWNSPRVICVAERYNKHDLGAAKVLPIKIELWKFCTYQNDTLSVEQETQQKTYTPTFKVSEKDRTERPIKKEKVIKEKSSHALDTHLNKASPETRALFETIHDKIVALDKSITIEPKAVTITYKSANVFVDIAVRKSALKIYLNVPSGELRDRYNIARDLTKPKKIGHWGSGDYDVILQSEKQIDRVFSLIKQSYSYNKKAQKEKAIKEDERRTLHYHLSKTNLETKRLFKIIHDKIVALDKSIIVEPQVKYIAYKLATDFVDIVVRRSGLKMWLNVPSGELHDPHNIAHDFTKPNKVTHDGKGDYQVILQKEEQINRVFRLIKQSYSYNKKAQKEKAFKEDNRRTLAYHLSKASPEIKTLFETIHNKIVALDAAITIEPKAVTITYKSAKVFVDIAVRKSALKIHLNMRSGNLNDPYNIARDLTKPKKVGHWGSGDYQIVLQKEEQINQAFELIKQSYNYNK